MHSDETTRSANREIVIKALTAETPSEGIESASQAEIEGELSSYLAGLKLSLKAGDFSISVSTLKTAVGVTLAGDRDETIAFLTSGTDSQGVQFADTREVTGELSVYFEELTTAVTAHDSATAVDRIKLIMGVSLAGTRAEVVRYLTQDTPSQGIEDAPVNEVLGELPALAGDMQKSLAEGDAAAFSLGLKTFIGVAISVH